MISHHSCPELLPGSLGACWVRASLCQILIDWTGSAILGHFVKAVKFIGIQQKGRQSGDGAYFVVLIESRSPSLQAALDRREALGESITITCPLVILLHSTSPNLTACYELFTTLSVQYTQPHWLTVHSALKYMESWKNNCNFEPNGCMVLYLACFCLVSLLVTKCSGEKKSMIGTNM